MVSRIDASAEGDEAAAGAVRSLPWPIERGDHLVAAAFYFAVVGPAAERQVRAPHRLAILDPRSEVVELADITPESFGIALGSGTVVGSTRRASTPRTREDLDQLLDEYGALLDRIVGFYGIERGELGPDQRAAVERFVIVFGELALPCLLPFYRGMNRSFFAWFSRVGRPVRPGD